MRARANAGWRRKANRIMKPLRLGKATIQHTTDWETVTLSTNPQFLALVERARTRQKVEGRVSSEEMRHRLGLGRAVLHGYGVIEEEQHDEYGCSDDRG